MVTFQQGGAQGADPVGVRHRIRDDTIDIRGHRTPCDRQSTPRCLRIAPPSPGVHCGSTGALCRWSTRRSRLRFDHGRNPLRSRSEHRRAPARSRHLPRTRPPSGRTARGSALAWSVRARPRGLLPLLGGDRPGGRASRHRDGGGRRDRRGDLRRALLPTAVRCALESGSAHGSRAPGCLQTAHRSGRPRRRQCIRPHHRLSVADRAGAAGPARHGRNPLLGCTRPPRDAGTGASGAGDDAADPHGSRRARRPPRGAGADRGRMVGHLLTG